MAGAQYMEMTLEIDGAKSVIFQKVAAGSQIVVTSQIVTYVDAKGVQIDLPDRYEMSVVDGKVLEALP